MSLPGGKLKRGSYVIQLQLTNFLGGIIILLYNMVVRLIVITIGTSEKSIQVIVGSKSVPIISIYGSGIFTIIILTHSLLQLLLL